jgi:uncharacterized membrane protein YhhN
MTGLATGLLVVFAVAAVADWVAEGTGRERVRYLTKPAALAALLGVALALDPASSTVRAWFVVALAFSLAGDVLLMLPSDRFVAGLAAFLVAHLAYIGGLLADGVSAGWLAAGLAVVAVTVVAIGRPLLAGVRRTATEMTVPVTAYMAVISAMVVCAIGTGDGLAIAGAALFYASDALIGISRFVRSTPWAPVAIMVTYHTGQCLLVLSLL